MEILKNAIWFLAGLAAGFQIAQIMWKKVVRDWKECSNSWRYLYYLRVESENKNND